MSWTIDTAIGQSSSVDPSTCVSLAYPTPAAPCPLTQCPLLCQYLIQVDTPTLSMARNSFQFGRECEVLFLINSDNEQACVQQEDIA